MRNGILQRQKKILILLTALLSAALLCLTACNGNNQVGYTYMTDSERAEFVKMCGEELEKCPEIEKYLGRIDKLKEQAEN